MHKIITLGEKCTGCSACMNICPNDAISIVVGNDGFYVPKINSQKCISCSRCDQICPQLGNRYYENDSEPLCYALAASDEIRWLCSSGGAFPLMAMQILKEGGKVYGCAYGEGMRAEHVGVDSLEELPKLYRSKYVESYIGYTYREVEADLKAGRTVLFCGTPCHIAALHAFLGQEYEKLFLVDFLCNSMSPAGIFLEYLEEMQRHFGKRITHIDFRTKQNGWDINYVGKTLPVFFEDGSCVNLENDLYFKGFLQHLFKKEACDTCYYCGTPRQGDLTIGDFWGIDAINPDLNDRKGLSIVLANSKKGQALLERLAPMCKKLEQIDRDIRKYNRFFNMPISMAKKDRKAHFYRLKRKYTTSKAIERAFKGKYDIGLVGDWSVPNYGAALTYYALFQVLTDAGYDVLMVERAGREKFSRPGQSPHQTPQSFAKNPYPSYALAPIYPDLVSMKELNEKCDTFLLGSDQLWNGDYFQENMANEYLLAFADTDKRKIAYATSFGRTTLEATKSDINKMRFLFRRLHKVSVRERSGVEICRENFDIPAEHVLDLFFCVILCIIRH